MKLSVGLLKKFKPRQVLNKFRPNSKSTFVLALATCLLFYAAFGLWQRYHKTHNPLPLPSDTQTIARSTDTPDETPIDLSSPYEVPADQPRKITLSSIGATGFIQKVGLDATQTVAVPTNIHLAGWYVNSAKPGDEGVSLIDGHVSGRYMDAIFKDLGKLKAADTITVEFGDHSMRTFEVISVELLSVQETSSRMLVQHDNIGKQLNLITCGGSFSTKSQQFDKRILVVSKYIK